MKPKAPGRYVCLCDSCSFYRQKRDQQLENITQQRDEGRIEAGDTWILDETLELVARPRPADIKQVFKRFAGFLGGLAKVLYVRAELRYSKGHKPFGKSPASGEVWDKEEIANAMVKVNSALFSALGEPCPHP